MGDFGLFVAGLSIGILCIIIWLFMYYLILRIYEVFKSKYYFTNSVCTGSISEKINRDDKHFLLREERECAQCRGSEHSGSASSNTDVFFKDASGALYTR
jgi:hypothetical protein